MRGARLRNVQGTDFPSVTKVLGLHTFYHLIFTVTGSYDRFLVSMIASRHDAKPPLATKFNILQPSGSKPTVVSVQVCHNQIV